MNVMSLIEFRRKNDLYVFTGRPVLEEITKDTPFTLIFYTFHDGTVEPIPVKDEHIHFVPEIAVVDLDGGNG